MNDMTRIGCRLNFRPVHWLGRQRQRLGVMARMLGALPPFLALMMGNQSLAVVDLMDAVLLKTPAFRKAVTHLQQDPACAALISERYMAPPHDLDALLQYPPDSLGYCYAVRMQAQGYRAEDLYAGFAITSDVTYLEARLSQTHDIWHTVTGFGTSPIDEIGLQAFHLPQFSYPLGVALVAGSLMATLLLHPDELPLLLETIAKGWQMGQQAAPLFAQKWEEAWEKPLAQWQAELHIQPV